MDTYTALIIIAVAAAIHASFQLSISVLTLLSSHAIGKKRSVARLTLLTHSFVLGVGVMTLLLLASFTFMLSLTTASVPLELLWTIGCGLMIGLGAAIALFYYRKESGTTLWVPRSVARYFSTRAKKTAHSAEAFNLGLMSVLTELLFFAVPLAVASLAIIQMPTSTQLFGVAIYLGVSLSSLAIIHVLVSGGHSISRLQRWREHNKGFLQLASACALVVLGFYLYVDQVATVAVLAAEKAVW